jgi:hypothetical protein
MDLRFQRKSFSSHGTLQLWGLIADQHKFFCYNRLKAIPKGAQVFDSYGMKCNHRFLMNYGFSAEKNIEWDGFCPNEVAFELEVDPKDPIFSDKLKFWMRGDEEKCYAASRDEEDDDVGEANDDDEAFVREIRICVADDENTQVFFSLLRTLSCNKEELEAVSAIIEEADEGDDDDWEVSNDDDGDDDGTKEGLKNRKYTNDEKNDDNDVIDKSEVRHNINGESTHCKAENENGEHVDKDEDENDADENDDNEDDEDEEDIPRKGKYRTCHDITDPICIRNEWAAMELLLKITEGYLSRYPTSLEQDVKDLEDTNAYPPFSNKRNATIHVRGEKEVLHHYKLWAKTALKVMDAMTRETESDLQTLVDHIQLEHDDTLHETIVDYCEDVLSSLKPKETPEHRFRSFVVHHRSSVRSSITNSVKSTLTEFHLEEIEE